MVDYAPGMRTIIRDEEWMVKKVEKNNMGNNALYCVGVSPLVKDKEAVFLTDLEEIAVVDPKDVKLVIDGSSFFRRTQLYLESQWRQQIPTDTDLHIGDKAAMDLMPYQLEPAQISLRRPRQRILIADTVGLGKTLEAGILMSELIARGKGRLYRFPETGRWERNTTARQLAAGDGNCRFYKSGSSKMVSGQAEKAAGYWSGLF